MEIKRKLCTNCSGQGWRLGVGYVRVTCENCDGGFLYPPPPVHQKTPSVKVDKRSKTYKQAIKKLKDLGLTDEQAHAEFKKGLNSENHTRED